jgi:hypothetical protein
LGVIGSPILLVSSTATLFGAGSRTSGVAFLFALPEIAWLLSLTVWLLVKGFRPSPILSVDARPIAAT